MPIKGTYRLEINITSFTMDAGGSNISKDEYFVNHPFKRLLELTTNKTLTSF